MKFFTSGIGPDNKPLLTAVWFFILFLFLYWTGSVCNYFIKFGISPGNISAYYFGPAGFPERISMTLVSEDAHVYLFTNAIMLLALSGLFLYTDFGMKTKTIILGTVFFLGMFDSVSGYFIFWGGKPFAWLKVFSFLSFNSLLLLILLAVVNHYFRRRPPGYLNGKGGEYFRNVIIIFAAANLLFSIISIFLFGSKLGWIPAQIVSFYTGNDDLFIATKSFSTLLETAVIHFAVTGIYLITLTHFVSFSNFSNKIFFTLLCFTSALFNILSGFLIRFLNTDFVYLKLASFCCLQASLIAASVILFKHAFANANGGE